MKKSERHTVISLVKLVLNGFRVSNVPVFLIHALQTQTCSFSLSLIFCSPSFQSHCCLSLSIYLSLSHSLWDETLWYSSTECITCLKPCIHLVVICNSDITALLFSSLLWDTCVLDSAACLSDGHDWSEYPSGDKNLSSVRNVLWDCLAFLRWDDWPQATETGVYVRLQRFLSVCRKHQQ